MTILTNINSGSICWHSPSNIALVKYWGKKTGQIPANPSLSITLSKAFTEMQVHYSPALIGSGQVEIEFWFEGEKNQKFKDKISQFITGLSEIYPVLSRLRLEIRSRNTFPHSSGIASSASSMSALGLCLATLLKELGNPEFSTDRFLIEASRLSRLASGSACRSVYGGFVVWGEAPDIPGSSDQFAVPFPFTVHQEMEDIRDAILVISKKEKSVSSRAGHSLMDQHPFAHERYRMARTNLSALRSALIKGDWELFHQVTEMEALVLHALMMSSNPSFFLFEPNTVSVVNAVRKFRTDTGVPVCFTLDAGPNIHLLYPGKYEIIVKDWIENELLRFCHDGFWIDDIIGHGPVRKYQ